MRRKEGGRRGSSQFLQQVSVVVQGNPKLCRSAEPFGTTLCSDLSVQNSISLGFTNTTSPIGGGGLSPLWWRNTTIVENFFVEALSTTEYVNKSSISILSISIVNASSELSSVNSSIGTTYPGYQEVRIVFLITLNSNYTPLLASSSLQAQGSLQLETLIQLLNNLTNGTILFIFATVPETPSFQITSSATARVYSPSIKLSSSGAVYFDLMVGVNQLGLFLSGHFSIAYRRAPPTLWTSKVREAMRHASSTAITSWDLLSPAVINSRAVSFYEHLAVWREIPFVGENRISLLPCGPTSRYNACLLRGVRYDVRVVGRWPSEVLYSDITSVFLPPGDPVVRDVIVAVNSSCVMFSWRSSILSTRY